MQGDVPFPRDTVAAAGGNCDCRPSMHLTCVALLPITWFNICACALVPMQLTRSEGRTLCSSRHTPESKQGPAFTVAAAVGCRCTGTGAQCHW
jgi:hypothetical protein